MWLAGLCVILIGVSYVCYNALGSDLLPAMDEGGFILDYVMPPGSSLQETNRVISHVEQIVRSVPEVESTSRRTGLQLGLAAVTEPNTGDISVKLKDKRSRGIDEIISEVRAQGEKRGAGARRRLHAGASGHDFRPDRRPAARRGQAVFTRRGPAGDVGAPRSGCAREGLRQRQEAGGGYRGRNRKHHERACCRLQRQSANRGEGRLHDRPAHHGRLRDRGRRTRHHSGDHQRPALHFARPFPAGEPGFARSDEQHDARQFQRRDRDSGSLATISEVPGQTEILRDNLQQEKEVTARLEGIDLGTGVAAVQKAVDEMHLPPSIRVEYGGTYQEQQKSFHDLVVVLLLALVLIFLVLLFEFRSFSAPIAILSSAVLSTSGVFLALLITRTTFNVSSFMGLIMVIGIVAKNGILLLDANQKFRAVGFSAEEAMIQAGRRRLRPIVMTAMAAVAGMLPLSLALGAGSQMLQPLAIAVIGGILISMVLSLIITPAMQFYLTRERVAELKE